jgi:hypothetical protein
MADKSERRAAREAVTAYHEAELSALIHRAGEAIDRFRAGELDAFETDQELFQYSRAAKELWKFCNLGDVVSTTAHMIAEQPSIDWWEREPSIGDSPLPVRSTNTPGGRPPTQPAGTLPAPERR